MFSLAVCMNVRKLYDSTVTDPIMRPFPGQFFGRLCGGAGAAAAMIPCLIRFIITPAITTANPHGCVMPFGTAAADDQLAGFVHTLDFIFPSETGSLSTPVTLQKHRLLQTRFCSGTEKAFHANFFVSFRKIIKIRGQAAAGQILAAKARHRTCKPAFPAGFI